VFILDYFGSIIISFTAKKNIFLDDTVDDELEVDDGWRDYKRSYNEVRELFNQIFCNCQIHIFKPTVDRTIKRFEQLGTMTNHPILGRQASATNEEKQLDVASLFRIYISLSLFVKHLNIILIINLCIYSTSSSLQS